VNTLPALAKLALGATTSAPAVELLVDAMDLVRRQTGAVSARLFYGGRDGFQGCGVGDEPGRYPPSALKYLQQRLLQLRVPLAFNLVGGEVGFITRAANKQQRDHIAWLVPTADSSTELLILRGSWPPDAVGPLLEFMDSGMPAVTIMLERFVGVGRTDALTACLNHRGGLEALHAALDTANRKDRPLSLVMADVDGFKLFNDTYGHVMGDDVLKLVADVCRQVAGPAGTVCRYGGDEFLVILPGEEREAATRVAEEISGRLGAAEFPLEGSSSRVPMAVSLGVATYPHDAGSPAKLVAVADSAMYAAKRRLGRGGIRAIAVKDDTTFGVLESLVLSVDAKDRYTKDHCDIVADYAVKLAERLNLSEEAQRALRVAGLLHDIGKLVVPDEILKKPGPLTPDEYEVMKRHVKIGEVLIREVPQLKDVIQAVSCHHERYDGRGYPRGLQGEGIPLLGRIIAVADAYSAMCLDRPYRKAMRFEDILQELAGGAGSQFDPPIVEAFLELLHAEQFQPLRLAA